MYSLLINDVGFAVYRRSRLTALSAALLLKWLGTQNDLLKALTK